MKKPVIPLTVISSDFDPAMNRVDPAAASAVGVIYARYSSHSQRDVSIEQQVKDCLDYAARNNIYIAACYADRHLTGRSDRRPEFHRMLRDAEAGKWAFVVTWKNDRFARNRYDAAIYKAKLKKCGVRCLFSQEYIPAGPEGILLEAMLEGDAEFRSAQMAVDIKRGLAYNAEHCMVTGAIPFGYRRTKDYTLELDPDRAPLVKEIYDRFLAGWKINFAGRMPDAEVEAHTVEVLKTPKDSFADFTPVEPPLPPEEELMMEEHAPENSDHPAESEEAEKDKACSGKFRSSCGVGGGGEGQGPGRRRSFGR